MLIRCCLKWEGYSLLQCGFVFKDKIVSLPKRGEVCFAHLAYIIYASCFLEEVHCIISNYKIIEKHQHFIEINSHNQMKTMERTSFTFCKQLFICVSHVHHTHKTLAKVKFLLKNFANEQVNVQLKLCLSVFPAHTFELQSLRSPLSKVSSSIFFGCGCIILLKEENYILEMIIFKKGVKERS